MKNLLIVLLLLFLTGFCAAGEDVSLTQQAALDFCSYPSLGEGILDVLYLAVDESWHSGDYKNVFPVLKLITIISPGEVNAWTLGGWFLINAVAPPLNAKEKENVIKYAIAFMKEGIDKNPEDYNLYMEMAVYYYRVEDYEKALFYLENGEKFPHPSLLPHLKAQIYRKTGMKQEELKEWEKIRESFPEMKDIAERFIREIREER